MTIDVTTTRAAGRWAAMLFGAQFILIWTTYFILSSAIGWPASLDDPAAVALPRLLAHPTAVNLGYGAYLLAALLLIPAVAALNARLRLQRDVAMLTVALAAFSATAKAIGITRWLFAMPLLARDYMATSADRAGIATMFDLLNAYAGGIGEVLGVGLISGLLTIMIGVLLARDRGRPGRAVGLYTVVAGALLLGNMPAGFGMDLGPLLTVSNIAWQFALLGVGVWSLTPPRA